MIRKKKLNAAVKCGISILWGVGAAKSPHPTSNQCQCIQAPNVTPVPVCLHCVDCKGGGFKLEWRGSPSHSLRAVTSESHSRLTGTVTGHSPRQSLSQRAPCQWSHRRSHRAASTT